MATTDELRPDSPGLAGTLVEPPPRLVPEEASDLVRTLYGVDGAASPLDSERDANFRIDAPDASYVLKVYNPAESDALVSMQTEMMLHVPSVDPELPVPRVVATREGELHGRVE
ncbi:MAG: phosphotransferase, partial [Actinobacteria bacterium]|nr:phosphotransferase [Actinomycetota bacterium]